MNGNLAAQRLHRVNERPLRRDTSRAKLTRHISEDNDNRIIRKETESPTHSQSSEEKQNCSEDSTAVCTDCGAGPLMPLSFRKLVNGESVSYETTRDKVKTGMDSGCGLCRLIWQYCSNDNPPLEKLSFQLAIESSPVRSWGGLTISPQRVQYISIIKSGRRGGNRYYIYASPDDPSAGEVIARNPILEVSSPRAYELAMNALNECIASHARCPKPDPQTPLPTRVIDCEDPSDPRLFVSQGTHSPYVALSYVWGGPQTYCAKTTNVDRYAKGIERQFIPQTIHDAIQVTNKLGLRYLWVDALCIIQDSDDDKARELVKMGQIYCDAYMTIVASSATAASIGFLETRISTREVSERVELPFHCHDGRVGHVFALWSDRAERIFEPMTEPVNRRAWCLQERLLSPRKLVYANDTVHYHCQTAQGGLGNALSGNPGSMGGQLDDIMFLPSSDGPDFSKWTSEDWMNLHERWRVIVANYTRRSLSYEGDKLLAFAGVAEAFDRVWAPRVGRYIAGIWERLLPDDLLWRRQSSAWLDSKPTASDPLRPRLSRAFAPSWSWASVDGHVRFEGAYGMWNGKEDRTMVAQVLECDVTLEDEGLPYGHVIAASLRLRALVVPTPWIVSPDLRDPDKSFSLYMPTDDLRQRMNEVRGETDIVVGERSIDGKGECVPTYKVTLQKHQLCEGNQLVALECGTMEDESLLTLMGDVSVSFDGSEEVVANETMVVVVRRFQIDNGPNAAQGLLLTNTGEGRFRRIGYWVSYVEPRANDYCSDRLAWLDFEYSGSVMRVIEIV